MYQVVWDIGPFNTPVIYSYSSPTWVTLNIFKVGVGEQKFNWDSEFLLFPYITIYFIRLS
jgi:hypothetical protein